MLVVAKMRAAGFNACSLTEGTVLSFTLVGKLASPEGISGLVEASGSRAAFAFEWASKDRGVGNLNSEFGFDVPERGDVLEGPAPGVLGTAVEAPEDCPARSSGSGGYEALNSGDICKL